MDIWRLLRSLGHRGLIAVEASWTVFDGLIASVDRGSKIIKVADRPGRAETPGPRVVIFCHFDRNGRIRDHTKVYLAALMAEGFELVFVSNSGTLVSDDLEWIRTRAWCTVLRRNIGFDFAAWRDAITIASLPAPDTEFLLLANDSVYGPLAPLGPMLDAFDFSQADVWGATDSWQHRFHLQSYFVAFGPRALRSPGFTAFWSSVQNLRSKWGVVRRYEIGLTRALIAAGLRCRAVWKYTDLVEDMRAATAVRQALDGEPAMQQADLFEKAAATNAERVLQAALRRVPLNPTAHLWRTLLRRGYPFLKRELLRDNPARVPDVAGWRSAIGNPACFNTDFILRDLERALRNRSP